MPETALEPNVVMSGLAVVPSPQLMVPEKSPVAAAVLASVKVALRLADVPPSMSPLALTVPAVRAASATLMVALVVAVPRRYRRPAR